MHGYTNSEFRLKCKLAGADMIYTEMIATEAIIRRIPKVFEMLKFKEEDRPIVAQIFGSKPEVMAEAAKIIERKFKPDGIDINFGCSVQKAKKQGFGSCQLKDAKRAGAIVRAVKKAVGLPVSAKIRLLNKHPADTISFIKVLEKSGIDAIAIHGRTPTQKFSDHADWGIMHKIKKEFPKLLILGNGDIKEARDLKQKIGNLDGALVGRRAIKNPNIFKELIKSKRGFFR